MQQAFDDSLPSHSVFVPANAASTRPKSAPKPFLRKGSRKEPSAVHRRGTSSSPVSPSTPDNLTLDPDNSNLRRSLTSTATRPHLTEKAPSETYGRDGHRQHHQVDKQRQLQHQYSNQGRGLRDSHARQSYDQVYPAHTDRAREALDTSIVSTSTLCFDDTSTIDLHQRWAQEKQAAQEELDEFVMIEQDLQSITVTPLLMTSTEAFPARAAPASLPHSSTTGTKGRHSGEEVDMRSRGRSSYVDAGRGWGGQESQGSRQANGQHSYHKRESEEDEEEHGGDDNEYPEDYDDDDDDEAADRGLVDDNGDAEVNSWEHQPASFFMGEGPARNQRATKQRPPAQSQEGLLEWTRLQPSRGTVGSSQEYEYPVMATKEGVGAYSTYASTRSGHDLQSSSTYASSAGGGGGDGGAGGSSALRARGGGVGASRGSAMRPPVSADYLHDDDDDDDEQEQEQEQEQEEGGSELSRRGDVRYSGRDSRHAAASDVDDDNGDDVHDDAEGSCASDSSRHYHQDGARRSLAGGGGGGGLGGGEQRGRAFSAVRRSAGSVDDSQSWGADAGTSTGTVPLHPPASSQRDRDSSLRYSSGGSGGGVNGAIGAGSQQQQPHAQAVRKSRLAASITRSVSRERGASQDSAGRKSATATATATAAPSASASSSAPRAVRPMSGGRTRPSAQKSKSTTAAPLADDIGPRLAQKARELEHEIETYKKENSSLKQVRKQQELILTDMEQQRGDLKAWIEAEKKKTSDFCSETKEAAIRERRAAAKYARDTKSAADAGSSGPDRRERAEMEALRATLEKTKLEHEEVQKKWKSNAVRLQQTCKENAALIAKLQDQVATFEAEKAKNAEERSEKKKKTRTFTYTHSADSYAEEQGGGRGDLDVCIEQRPARTSKDVITATSGARAGDVVGVGRSKRDFYETGGDDFGASGGDFEEEYVYAGRSRQSDANDTLDSELLEYGTLTNYDDLNADHDDDDRNDANNGRHDDHEYQEVRGSGVYGGGGQRSSGGGGGLRGTKHTSSATATATALALGSSPSVDPPPPTYDPSRYADQHQHQPHRQAIQPQHQHQTSSTATSTSKKSLLASTATAGATSTSRSSTSHNLNGSLLGTANSSGSSRSSPRRVTETTPDGVQVTKYSNGTVKKVHLDGQQEVMFLNGDTKRTLCSGTVVYYYANAETTHTTHVDGSEVYEFPNNQVEKHYADGRKEITFPNKTKKTIYPGMYEESVFPDGVVVREYPGGRKEVIKPQR